MAEVFMYTHLFGLDGGLPFAESWLVTTQGAPQLIIMYNNRFQLIQEIILQHQSTGVIQT